MSKTEITSADVPNCSDEDLEKRRCDIARVFIDEFVDYGAVIGLMFVRRDGNRFVVHITRGQAAGISGTIWNIIRKPGETR